MDMFLFIIFAIISVVCSWRFQPFQAILSLIFTLSFTITELWYLDMVLYTWFFFIFTSDLGMLAIAAFGIGYKSAEKDPRKL